MIIIFLVIDLVASSRRAMDHMFDKPAINCIKKYHTILGLVIVYVLHSEKNNDFELLSYTKAVKVKRVYYTWTRNVLKYICLLVPLTLM